MISDIRDRKLYYYNRQCFIFYPCIFIIKVCKSAVFSVPKYKFDMFMKKVNEIKFVSPNTKVIISPIVPTVIPELNSRAHYLL